MKTDGSPKGPRQLRVETALSTAFTPSHLSVENESSRHAVPPGSETHFKVILVSESFGGKSLVARHQEVYRRLAEEMASGLHALSLELFTTAEWSARAGAMVSPPCAGGENSKK